MLGREVELAFLLQEPTQCVVGGRVAGVMLDDLLVAIDRLGIVLAVDLGFSEEGQVIERSGLDLVGSAEPIQSIVPTAFELQCQCEADVGLRHLRVLPDSFTVAPPRLGEMTQGAIDIAEVVVSLRHLRLQRDGSLTMRQRLIGAAGFKQKLTEVVPRGSKLGVEVHRPFHVFECLVLIPQRA